MSLLLRYPGLQDWRGLPRPWGRKRVLLQRPHSMGVYRRICRILYYANGREWYFCAIQHPWRSERTLLSSTNTIREWTVKCYFNVCIGKRWTEFRRLCGITLIQLFRNRFRGEVEVYFSSDLTALGAWFTLASNLKRFLVSDSLFYSSEQL